MTPLHRIPIFATVDGALGLTFSEAVSDKGDGTGMSGFAVADDDMKFEPAEVAYKVGKVGRKLKYK